MSNKVVDRLAALSRLAMWKIGWHHSTTKYYIHYEPTHMLKEPVVAPTKREGR